MTTRAPTQTQADLLDVLPEEVRARVLAGELRAEPGKDRNKPVLIDAATGRLAKGTGHRPGGQHGALGEMSKKYAYKRRKGFREALETIISSEEDPTKPMTLGWLINRLIEDAGGGPVNVSATCPECDTKFKVEAYRKGDPMVLFKVAELLVGRARETQDLNISAKHVYAMLDERVAVTELRVHAIDPEEVAARRLALQAAPMLDGDYREVDD